MPIYDSDGSANREIGKVYDHNGSVNTQIGKVYDNNGSANSLIYSADLYVWNNGNCGYTLYPRTKDTGSANPSSFAVSVSPTNTDRGAALLYANVDFTGWNTITINYSYGSHTYARGAVGYGLALGSGDLGTVVAPTFFSSYVDTPYGITSGSNTYTASISSVNGTQQVGAWVHSDSSVQAWANIQINYILLT